MINSIIEMLISGLSIGSTYALIALGYTMVYGIAKMLNFAHGDIIMVGGYTVAISVGFMNPYLGMLVSVIFCVILGVTIEKVAYRPLRGASPLAVLITAIGISYLLQALAQLIFGANPKPATLPDYGITQLGEIKVKTNTLISLGVAVIIMIALSLFVKYTKTGRAMIAVSEDRGAAQLMGINVNRIIVITFAIGSALAAVAGYFMLAKSGSVTSTTGAMPGIKAFTAAVIGGIGSIPGAMVGGILLGIVEALCQTIDVLKPYTDAIEFLSLIVILLVKPTGILGKIKREKV